MPALRTVALQPAGRPLLQCAALLCRTRVWAPRGSTLCEMKTGLFMQKRDTIFRAQSLFTELMTGQSSTFESPKSVLTLAVLADSGWYEVVSRPLFYCFRIFYCFRFCDCCQDMYFSLSRSISAWRTSSSGGTAGGARSRRRSACPRRTTTTFAGRSSISRARSIGAPLGATAPQSPPHP